MFRKRKSAEKRGGLGRFTRFISLLPSPSSRYLPMTAESPPRSTTSSSSPPRRRRGRPPDPGGPADRGPDRGGGRHHDGHPGGGPCPPGGRPGAGQDADGRRRWPRRWSCFNRVQFTPDLMPGDITGTEIVEEDPATGKRAVPVRPGADLRQRRAGRRDQPHPAQDPGRAAPGDAGAPGHGGGQDLSAAATRSSCWPRRTRSSRKGPTRCPRPSSTASCSNCGSGYPTRSEEERIVEQTTGTRQGRCESGARCVRRCSRCRGWCGGSRCRGSLIRAAVLLARMTRPDEAEAPALVKRVRRVGGGAARVAVPGARRQGACGDGWPADGRPGRCAGAWRRRCCGTGW